MTDPTEVWNRALEYDVPLTAEGDVALRNALTFDGSVQNGGLLDAIENYETDEDFPLDIVLQSYAFLGMTETARLIREARPKVAEAVAGALTDDEIDALETGLNEQYPAEGEDLDEAFQRVLAERPQAFAPV